MLLDGFKFAAETQICWSIPYAVVFTKVDNYKSPKTYYSTKASMCNPWRWTKESRNILDLFNCNIIYKINNIAHFLCKFFYVHGDSDLWGHRNIHSRTTSTRANCLWDLVGYWKAKLSPDIVRIPAETF
jgi:hypothetical protein